MNASGSEYPAEYRAAVVIPVYRPEPNPLERISLAQCCRVLGKHQLVLVCANTFGVVPYLACCREHGCDPRVETFVPACFTSVDEYNKLLLHASFYRRFAQYSFVLIYQLDAFVFKDALDHWCGRGYDYVGAPWFERGNESTAADPLLESGGNGGLSLRRTAAFINVLSPPFPQARVRTWADLWRKHRNRTSLGKLVRLPRLLGKYFRKSNLYGNYLSQPAMFEDIFFSFVVPRVFPHFKVAPAADGMFFAFECQPRRMFGLTARELPFGCHAWDRYDPLFWKPIIESFGYVLPPGTNRIAP